MLGDLFEVAVLLDARVEDGHRDLVDRTVDRYLVGPDGGPVDEIRRARGGRQAWRSAGSVLSLLLALAGGRGRVGVRVRVITFALALTIILSVGPEDCIQGDVADQRRAQQQLDLAGPETGRIGMYQREAVVEIRCSVAAQRLTALKEPRIDLNDHRDRIVVVGILDQKVHLFLQYG